MLAQLVDVIEEGKALHSAYGDVGYCEEVFLTTVQNFAHSVKMISNNLGEIVKEAVVGHEERMQQNLHNAGTESVTIERDPGITSSAKDHISLVWRNIPPAQLFQKKKNRVHSVQNCMKNIHFWNTAQKPIGHSVLRVVCFEMKQDLRRLTGRLKE